MTISELRKILDTLIAGGRHDYNIVVYTPDNEQVSGRSEALRVKTITPDSYAKTVDFYTSQA